MPPHFLDKLRDMIQNPANADIICWTDSGDEFIIFDQYKFETQALRLHMPRIKDSSFRRYLSLNGFRRTNKQSQVHRVFHHPTFRNEIAGRQPQDAQLSPRSDSACAVKAAALRFSEVDGHFDFTSVEKNDSGSANLQKPLRTILKKREAKQLAKNDDRVQRNSFRHLMLPQLPKILIWVPSKASSRHLEPSKHDDLKMGQLAGHSNKFGCKNGIVQIELGADDTQLQRLLASHASVLQKSKTQASTKAAEILFQKIVDKENTDFAR